MIKLEDLLLTAYCDVAIMDNIYPVMTINYKYDAWKHFSKDFLACFAKVTRCTKNNTLLKPSSRIANAEANVLPVPVADIKSALSSPCSRIFLRFAINLSCMEFGFNRYFSSDGISSLFAISR